MTLTTEQYTEGLCGDGAAILCDGVPMSVSEILAALNSANREVQPVGWLYDGDKALPPMFVLGDNDPSEYWKVKYERVYTAPPAPAVPGIDELRLAFERAERESDDGFNLHKYGIGYADEATQARWESWLACRAAMLAAAPEGGNG
ncbi:hypothetical protein [Serratia marcescens]|uniref:hypothetical protein n=1 Tax=Serratia marcescens TaxID=615 RepID=UPI004045FC75